MIGRHLLAWLWLLLWLTSVPAAHARVINSDSGAPAFAATDGHGDQHVRDVAGVHFQALRASRRIDFQLTSTDPLAGIGAFDAGIARQQDGCGAQLFSEASLELASSWQFLLRAALSPRAPSFVS